jgi:flagellar basal-body rod protein FlgB
MTDAVSSAIQIALHGLSDRQTVTDNNIANVNTPGYIAQSTDFETNLQKALDGGSVVNLNPVHENTTTETNVNGNNVDIDNETVTQEKTEMQFEGLIEAMTAKFQILKNSIGS